MARKPKVGSRAWEEQQTNTPEFARSIIKDLKHHAKQGHPEAVDSILRWLEKFPELKSEVRELDDLAAKAEAAWVSAVAAGDPLAEQAARGEAAGLRADLLGPAPSTLDKILAGTVVVAHMGYQRAAFLAAQRTDQSAVREERDRRLSAAQKRLHEAVKGWKLIAGKKAKGLRPKGNLKVFQPCQEAA